MFSKSSIANLVGVCGRNSKKVLKILPGKRKSSICVFDNIDDLPKVDLVVLAVSDTAIKSVSKKLYSNTNLKNSIIVHTSGSVSCSALSDHKKYGSYYPLQTFTKGRRMGYKTIPHCIFSCDEQTTKKLTVLAQSISNDVRQINDIERKQIHLSAVLVNNLVNHIIYLAQQRLECEKIESDILFPLIEETISKVSEISAFIAQTGPARRGDHQTVDNHIKLLSNDKSLRDIYKIISQSIIKTYHS